MSDKGKEVKDVNRLGRVADTRRMAMRDAEIAQIVAGSNKHALDFDKSEIEDGWEYHWVRDSYLGKIDESRMPIMHKLGWEPVPIERHPERMNQYIAGRESPLSSYVHYKGLILHDRPSKWGKIQREQEERLSLQNMITPAVAQSMVTDDMKKAGWHTKVLQNQTNVEQEFKTFKD